MKQEMYSLYCNIQYMYLLLLGMLHVRLTSTSIIEAREAERKSRKMDRLNIYKELRLVCFFLVSVVHFFFPCPSPYISSNTSRASFPLSLLFLNLHPLSRIAFPFLTFVNLIGHFSLHILVAAEVSLGFRRILATAEGSSGFQRILATAEGSSGFRRVPATAEGSSGFRRILATAEGSSGFRRILATADGSLGFRRILATADGSSGFRRILATAEGSSGFRHILATAEGSSGFRRILATAEGSSRFRAYPSNS
jgi:hypothetical protein